VHPLRLYKLPPRLGGWWLSRIVGSKEVHAELENGYSVAYHAARRGVVVQTKGGPPLTVDDAIAKGVLRLTEEKR
jgi:hypothetical protein